MTGSHGAADRRPRASAAFAAYRAGRSGEAEAIGRAILAHDPRDAGAHYVCGLVAADRGALDRARQAFETAAALAPDKASLQITLGNLALRQGETRRPSVPSAWRWRSRRARWRRTPTSAQR